MESYLAVLAVLCFCYFRFACVLVRRIRFANVSRETFAKRLDELYDTA